MLVGLLMFGRGRNDLQIVFDLLLLNQDLLLADQFQSAKKTPIISLRPLRPMMSWRSVRWPSRFRRSSMSAA